MDLLDRIPGVVRAQASSFPISYRGQTGSRLRIQQNGARRAGLNPQGYLAQDLNVSNLSTARVVGGIEKAIYGSGAIGGVLVLEDRQAIQKAPNSIFSQFRANNNARQLGFRWNTGNNKTNLEIAGNGINTENFHLADGQTARNSAIQEYNLSSSVTTEFRKTKVYWRQKWSTGNWQFPQGFQNNPFELRELNNSFTYQSDIKINYDLKNDWKITQQVWGLLLETDQKQDQYNAQFDAINFQIERSYRRFGFGYNGILKKSFDHYSLKTGMDLYTSRLDENRSERDRVQNSSTDALVARRLDQQTGVFLQANSIGQKVQWTGVIRGDLAVNSNLDAQRVYTSAVSGGIEANWSVWKTNHQISIGRYFRFPRPEESGGELFGGRGIFRGNPDIRPEYSYQLDWSITKKLKSTTLKINSWLTHFDDRIVEVPIAQNVFQYGNIEQARTFGLEWQISQVLLNQKAHNLMGYISGLAMRGDDLAGVNFFSKGSRSNGIPPAHVQGKLKYKTWLREIPLQFGIDVRHFLEFIAPSGFTNQVWAVRDAPAYTLIGLSTNTRLHWGKHSLSLTMSVTNLTDQPYFPFGTRIMGMGRDFQFGLNYIF